MSNWSKDLEILVDSVPFGEVTPTITKSANRVTKVQVASAETIRYEESQTALDDISKLIQNMHDISYEGEIVFKLIMKAGQIQRVAYYNNRVTNYSELKQNNGNKKKAPDTKK